MDILVYGAGVCGSYLASELFLAKQNVTLLARGERLEYLRENGVTVKHGVQKSWTTAKVPVIAKLTPEAYYDVVFVVVKKTDLEGTLPMLGINKKCPLYIFLGNNGDIRQVCRGISDASRLAFGYPVGGGRLDKGIVYSSHPDHPVLTLGETLGRESSRLSEAAALFKNTPIRVDISPNIDVYLKYRLAVSLPLAAAIRQVSGDMKKLSASNETLELLAAAFKEGFRVLEALGHTNEPPAFIRNFRLPRNVVAFHLKRLAAKETGELAIRDLAMDAPEELAALSDDFCALKARSGVQTPSLDRLLERTESPEPETVLR